jgi:hypothetical protein
MMPNGVYVRLAAELKQLQASINARLDAVEAKIDLFLEAAGLDPRPGPSPPVEAPHRMRRRAGLVEAELVEADDDDGPDAAASRGPTPPARKADGRFAGKE